MEDYVVTNSGFSPFKAQVQPNKPKQEVPQAKQPSAADVKKQAAEEKKIAAAQARAAKAAQTAEAKEAKKKEAEEKKIAKRDEALEKTKLIMMIKRYETSERFGPFLKKMGFKFTGLEKKKVEDLHNMVIALRFAISNRTTNKFWQQASYMGVGLIEQSLNPVYDVTGLNNAVHMNPEYLDALEQLMLENQSLAFLDPKYKMAYIICQTAYQCHQITGFIDNRPNNPDRLD